MHVSFPGFCKKKLFEKCKCKVISFVKNNRKRRLIFYMSFPHLSLAGRVFCHFFMSFYTINGPS